MSSGGWVIWGLAVSGFLFLAGRACRIWWDASRYGCHPAHRLGWALLGAVSPSRYWWRARIKLLSPGEQADLLASETAALGLNRADSLRCPLCGAEVPRAWELTSDGCPTVGPGSVECPRCDFRLDCCRHCAHFLLGRYQTDSVLIGSGGDITFGRCNRYKAPQPVEQVCSPEIARRLKARGYEQLGAPLPIVDSFVPPGFCTAFRPDRKRLKDGGIRWPDARRIALLHLLVPPLSSSPQTALVDEPPSGDAQWLL